MKKRFMAVVFAVVVASSFFAVGSFDSSSVSAPATLSDPVWPPQPCPECG